MKFYDHKRIEKKWQRIWKASRLYRTREPKEVRRSPKPTTIGKGDSRSLQSLGSSQKCYVLDMFPYPSGDGLHVGHPKGYIATDVYSRMKQMQGKAILHPMGWDAFGLPAENYAIANKIHPRIAVERNIRRFKKQLELLGFNYDWEREINTSDPHYYRWTQWIFLEFFRAGLVYRSDEPINWCPSCKTGLANEDLENGRCERCGSVVEKRPIPQWVIRITDYAEKLLDGLADLNWPEHIKEQQRNWIGKSEGMLFTAPVKGADIAIQTFSAHFEAFRADTFVVIAPDHPLLPKLVAGVPNRAEILSFADALIKKRAAGGYDTQKELEGIFTGRYIVDPVGNGELPIWVASYALSEYGTGIVKCSCHDERDFEFAKKYDIPLKPVLFPEEPDFRRKVERLEVCYADMRNGILENPLEFSGKKGKEARVGIIEHLERNGLAVRKTTYRLRDWVFSRQRYWGEPIPLVFCPACKIQSENQKPEIGNPKQNQKPKITNPKSFSRGELQNPGWIAVPDDKLPVKLPKVDSYEPTGTGESPLANIPHFVNTKCPRCGGPARRETNTMPQWAGSSWYHIAYCICENSKPQTLNSKQFLNFKSQKGKRAMQKWQPVNLYVGGAEHATRHLIYARFWHKFLNERGIVPTAEPFERLQSVGLILASDGRKMSKRYGNVINPDEIVARFGADSLRLYEMFMGPFNQSIAWNTDSLVGTHRFLERVWRIRFKIKDLRLKKKLSSERKSGNLNLETLLHQTIKKVTEDIEALRFNTAVSALMILANGLEKQEAVSQETYETFLKLLAPFAPYLSEELWSEFGHTRSIHREVWPQYDSRLIEEKTTTIVVQVNGKIRADFEASRGESAETLKERALQEPLVLKWIEGKSVKKIIVVPNRLINIVV